jgi:hypothetical protein
MREVLVTELVKECLGPRAGINEVLNTSPLNEYITGVLAPHMETSEELRDIDVDAAIPEEVSQEYEGETADREVDFPPLFSPPLDPKSRPTTMGLSFILEGDVSAHLHLCISWAKYSAMTRERGMSWRREPRAKVLEIRLNDPQRLTLISRGVNEANDPVELGLYKLVRSRGNQHHVTLYLVNRISVPEGEHATAEDHIFQPQIRVICPEDTRLVPGLRKTPDSEEEQTLEFLYENRRVLARGHLCSAVWNEIDPENEYGGHIDFEQCRNEPPFCWIDRGCESLSNIDRARFAHPDVRTEFIPVYCIPSPRVDEWPADSEPPELHAGRLADMWNRDELRMSLSRLADGYENWIRDLENRSTDLSQSSRSNIAHASISNCRSVLSRIRTGIEILWKDEESRLAFCFANKALDTQYRWTNHGRELVWYPFQLAFLLMTVDSIVDQRAQSRSTCDLLWIPTGAGKTEAYLAVTAFAIAYRRRRAMRRLIGTGDHTGAGISVITRYTLRLLTIQQFRRAAALMTACEYLRVSGLASTGSIGWRPEGCSRPDLMVWGFTPFSIGLWVGKSVTPNVLDDQWTGHGWAPGALSILSGTPNEENGEPAQILNCPACEAVLALPARGVLPGHYTFHMVVGDESDDDLAQVCGTLQNLNFQTGRVLAARTYRHESSHIFTLSVDVETTSDLRSQESEAMLSSIRDILRANGHSIELLAAHPARLGYFKRHYTGTRGQRIEYDFEVFCPNPACPLHVQWAGAMPAGWIEEGAADIRSCADTFRGNPIPDQSRLIQVQSAFRCGDAHIADRIPIPNMTVDDQIYQRLPTLLIATVDKFARPPYEARTAALFGNVEFHHCLKGYFRPYQHGDSANQLSPSPAGRHNSRNFREISRLDPPDLILQDELHLIDGPLGSLVGIYETAVDYLCRQERQYMPKVLASTATIRRAREQVQSVFLREVQIFPPPGLSASDRFLIRERETHALDDQGPGRLYVGLCAPGRGPHTPFVRIWSTLLQTVWVHHDSQDFVRTFWTLTGYFNAVRELGGARALYRQDIIQRINGTSENPRLIVDDDRRAVELSGRTQSTDLPAILEMLNRRGEEAPDALFTTSMFGTGVDISRIGLMVVNGQPKTTSSYIQSTGRVGRSRGALVATFFRATRPRDLSHYEFFCGYHRQLHRFVEPITVYPFAPGVLDRAAGPVGVFILRNMRNTQGEWHRDGSARNMAQLRSRAPEVLGLPSIFQNRSDGQPTIRRPRAGSVSQFMGSELDRWWSFASNLQDLNYVDYAINTPPRHNVVLGDAVHQHGRWSVVYENAPQSLRDIEETTGFQT